LIWSKRFEIILEAEPSAFENSPLAQFMPTTENHKGLA
jgi:hypothetical protein